MGTKFKELLDDPAFILPDHKSMIEQNAEIIVKLIEIRKQNGLSQRDLAERCGVKQSAIARLERMGAMPKIHTLTKILKSLGYKLEIVPDKKRR